MKFPSKPIIGIGIYKGTKREWESIVECSRRMCVHPTTVTNHIENGESLNGFILKFKKESDNMDREQTGSKNID